MIGGRGGWWGRSGRTGSGRGLRRAGAALLACSAGVLAGPVAAAPAGAVRVRYVAPERFTDADDSFGSGLPLRVTLAEMTRILEELGRARLAPGESLDLDVLDIDRAGYDRPGFGTPTGVRVVTEATPPRIRLAYVLRRAGRVAAQGEDTVTDIAFLLTANARLSTGALSYERAVLRDWFARRFPRPPGDRPG